MHGLEPDGAAHTCLDPLVHRHGRLRRCGCAPTRSVSASRKAPPPSRSGLAQFPNDFQTATVDAERDHANIVSWNTYERGGHYAAHQAPDLLVDDMRRFFARVPR